MLVDSHCHLDFNDFEEDFEDVLARARENGVTAMLNAGNNIDELDKQLEISEKYPLDGLVWLFRNSFTHAAKENGCRILLKIVWIMEAFGNF